MLAELDYAKCRIDLRNVLMAAISRCYRQLVRIEANSVCAVREICQFGYSCPANFWRVWQTRATAVTHPDFWGSTYRRAQPQELELFSLFEVAYAVLPGVIAIAMATYYIATGSHCSLKAAVRCSWCSKQ